MTIRQDALNEASQLIHGDREDHYGKPEDNFARIAERWSQIIGTIIPPHVVALAMADLKLARLANDYHRDSIIDAIGYLAIAAELAETEDPAAGASSVSSARKGQSS